MPEKRAGVYAVKFVSENDLERGLRQVFDKCDYAPDGQDVFLMWGRQLDELDKIRANYISVGVGERGEEELRDKLYTHDSPPSSSGQEVPMSSFCGIPNPHSKRFGPKEIARVCFEDSRSSYEGLGALFQAGHILRFYQDSTYGITSKEQISLLRQRGIVFGLVEAGDLLEYARRGEEKG